MELKNLSSNWKKLQASIQPQKSDKIPEKPRTVSQTAGLKRKKSFAEAPRSSPKRFKNGKSGKMDSKVSEDKQISREDAKGIVNSISRKSLDASTSSRPLTATDRENEGLAVGVEIGKYVAIDCEMVGVGPNPDKESALARVSAVNYNGDQVYDSYVLPKEEVTDYRTHVSGIQPKHLAVARTLKEVQGDIAKLLDGRILVGHAINNDLRALMLSHPKRDIRDTSKHKPFRRYAGGGTPKLKILASELLGVNIQSGEHSSVEDARATMLIFRREKDGFEKEHAKNFRPLPEPSSITNSGESTSNHKKTNHKKKKSKRS